MLLFLDGVFALTNEVVDERAVIEEIFVELTRLIF